MSTAELRALLKVADAAFLASQSQLAALRDQETALREKLAQITEARRGLAQADRSSGDAALAAGADALWLQWIAQRQTMLQTQMAQLQARKAHQFELVRKAFGRKQAIHALSVRQSMAANQKRDRLPY